MSFQDKPLELAEWLTTQKKKVKMFCFFLYSNMWLDAKHVWQVGGAVVSTVTLQQEAPGFDSGNYSINFLSVAKTSCFNNNNVKGG